MGGASRDSTGFGALDVSIKKNERISSSCLVWIIVGLEDRAPGMPRTEISEPAKGSDRKKNPLK